MKYCYGIAILLFVVALLVPAVSAYDYEQTFSESDIISGYATYTPKSQTYNIDAYFDKLFTNKLENFNGLKSVVTTFNGYDVPKSGVSKSTPVTAKIGTTTIGEGIIGYNVNYKADTSWKNTIYFIEFNWFNPSGYSGTQTVNLEWDTTVVPKPVAHGFNYGELDTSSDGYSGSFIQFQTNTGWNVPHAAIYQFYVNYNWKNSIQFTGNSGDIYIDILRYNSGSYVEITDTTTGSIVYSNVSNLDASTRVFANAVNASIKSPKNNVYYVEYPVETGGQQTSNTLTVYVRNSQTGALLANAHIVINASVNNEFYEVLNETLPSGIYSIDLQPTGGGLPNPDYYRLIANAEGYNSIMPYIDFEVDGATTIYVYMEPTGGAPTDENKTFIDFYVRDLNANPVSGATVKFGAYTLITNSAGYTIFEVDKNNAYTWIVSKSGYGSLTGNVVIGADPRHTINTVLAPIVTPTTSTTIPTSTPIGPTPTLTAPTGEPTSNLLEWFAAHFGMILGGGVEIGKIFMWLCFSVPVGVYVGKEAKAGAAGFMAGAGIVTLFFVLIGWVPIWLLVLLALIIGLLYAKVFNNSDTGGGR